MAVAMTTVLAAAFLTAGSATYPRVDTTAAPDNDDSTECCAESVAANPAPPLPRPVSAAELHGDDLPAGNPFAAGPLITEDYFADALPVDVSVENGLQVSTVMTARAIRAMFPEINEIGGVRSDPLRWHPDGLALDVMIPNYNSPESIRLGDQIVSFVLMNADNLGVDHAIWRQVLYSHDGPPQPMEDRGSDNQNHYNHVHIATDGGGYFSGP